MKRKLKQYGAGEEVQTGQNQPQGGQDQVIQQVTAALQQGAPVDQIVMQLMQQFQDPQAVAQILMQAGIPQEQVMQIMEQVMQGQGQGEAPVEGQEPTGEHESDPMEGMEGAVPQMAFGGPFGGPGDPVKEINATDQDQTVPAKYQGKNFHWAPASPTNEQEKYWFTLGDRLANIRDRLHENNDPKISYQFNAGGPVNFNQILEEGGEALRASMVPKPTGFSKDNPETYVKDLQSTFASIVARNNVNANLNRNFEDLKNIFADVPKAANGLEVMSRDEYAASRNSAGFDKTSAEAEWDKFHNGNANRTMPNANPSFTGGIPYTIPWSPYGQQNPNMQLNPFAQILGAFQPVNGGMPNVRSRGDARGLEQAFMQNPMGGVTADGRHWSVSDVEQRGLFKNKMRYNIQWDGPQGSTSAETNATPTPTQPVDEKFNQNMVDFVSRFAPRLASRMVPSFAPANTQDGPSPEELQLINNAFTSRNNPAAIGATNPLRNASMTGTGPYAENFADGGSFTVKNPMYDINYGMLADGIYGAGTKAASFIDSMNRGIDPANKFNNTRIENVQGTSDPMTEGLYDQWGRFVPNDLSAQVLPGTGDKSAEYAGRDNTVFGGTKVFAGGGSYNVGDEFDLDDEEESRIAEQLKAAGYTFKRVNK